MSRNLYCFELYGFNNIPIIYKDEQSLFIRSTIFSFYNISNEELLTKIELKLKKLYNDTREVKFYLIEFNYGKNFRYFAIEFESELFKTESELFHYPYQYSEEEYNKFRKKFEEMDELICTSYFMTDIFINHSVEYFIEQKIIEKFEKEKLGDIDNQTIKLSRQPFLIEISSHYSLDYGMLIKLGIKSFFDNNFPRLSERLPINVIKFTFDFLLEKEERKFTKAHCKEIMNQVSYQIGILYSHFYIPHNHFLNQLSLYDNFLQGYDQSTLNKLEGYLKNLKLLLFNYSPQFFIREIDEIIYNYVKDNGLKLELHQSYPYIDNILQYTKSLFIDYENLKEDLKDMIKKVSYLKLQKPDELQEVDRLQKEEIFLIFEESSEDDFTQLFFAPLVRAMDFENIKVKGHKIKTLEYGQDIKLMKFRLPTGHFLNFVAQVKKGDIKSSSKVPSKEIERILTEIRPAFNKKVFDDEIGKSFKPHHVFLVSTGIINEYARLYLEEQIEDEYRGQLLLLERDKLYDLYVKYGLSKPEQAALTDYLKKIKERKEALEESKNVNKKVLIEDFLSKLSSFEGLMGLLLNEEVWEHDKYTKDINGTFLYLIDLGLLNESDHQEFNDLKNRQKLAYLKGTVPSIVQIKQDIALIESLKSRVEEEIRKRALYEDSFQ